MWSKRILLSHWDLHLLYVPSFNLKSHFEQENILLLCWEKELVFWTKSFIRSDCDYFLTKAASIIEYIFKKRIWEIQCFNLLNEISSWMPCLYIPFSCFSALFGSSIVKITLAYKHLFEAILCKWNIKIHNTTEKDQVIPFRINLLKAVFRD